MPNTEGTRTEQNLRAAISGETQAWGLYELFAERAEKDGFQEIAAIFKETAHNERAHAEIYWNLLNCIQKTVDNLKNAKDMELHETNIMYPEFAKIAREEGFSDIADTLEKVGKIEADHAKRFEKLENELRKGEIFARSTPQTWICTNCGHHANGPDAPTVCPVCGRPVAYFKLQQQGS